jgi:hypothetical protein
MTMATIRPNPDLPAEVDHAVRAAAAAQPPPRQDFGGVLAKARGHRRRRLAVRSGAAVTLVAALLAAVPVLQSQDGRGSVAALPTPAAAPGERPIYLGGAPAILLNTAEGEAVYIEERFPGGVVARFQADGAGGTLASLPEIPGLVGATESYAVADGWLAGIGSSGPQGAIRRLMIMDEAGKVIRSRDIELRPGATVPRLLTASRTTAYYQVATSNETTLVGLDLSTGAERDLRRSSHNAGANMLGFAADTTAGRVVIWPVDPRNNCSADVLDATGKLVIELRPAIANCSRVRFTLSPDGALVAALVTYANFDHLVQRLVVLDVGTGQVRKEFDLVSLPIYKLAAPTDRQMVAGIHWTDPTSLVYVRGPRPAHGGGNTPATVQTLQV